MSTSQEEIPLKGTIVLALSWNKLIMLLASIGHISHMWPRITTSSFWMRSTSNLSKDTGCPKMLHTSRIHFYRIPMTSIASVRQKMRFSRCSTLIWTRKIPRSWDLFSRTLTMLLTLRLWLGSMREDHLARRRSTWTSKQWYSCSMAKSLLAGMAQESMKSLVQTQGICTTSVMTKFSSWKLMIISMDILRLSIPKSSWLSVFSVVTKLTRFMRIRTREQKFSTSV